MARPVESAPPGGLRKADPGVKRAAAPPEKVAHRPVAGIEKGRKDGQERVQGHPLDNDRVTLRTEESPNPPPTPNIDSAGATRPLHLDVDG